MSEITKDSKLTFVEPPATQYGEYNGELSQDIYSDLLNADRASPTIEARAREAGWTDVRSINAFCHGKEGKFSLANELRIFRSDILGVSPITRTSRQSMQLIKLVKESKPDLIGIVGGFDATARAKEYLESGFDVVVKGEGELTFSELMERIVKSGLHDLKGIKGISYMSPSGEIINNSDRELLTAEQLGQMPHPYYDSKVRQGVLTAPLETSRGCPNDCSYCGVTEFYGRKYRTKPIEYVLDELKNIQGMGRYIFITDDNFAANPTRTVRLLEAIVDSGIKHNEMGAQVTVKVAENPDVINAMKKAGIKQLFIGIESTNDQSLTAMGKPYKAEQNMVNVELLRQEGFRVHGMLMAHVDYDTSETLKEMNEWANENLDSMQLFAITPVPGTRFWNEMESQDRILTKDFSLYDGFNAVCRPNPEHFTPIEFQEAINDFYLNFYSPKNMLKRIAKSRYKLFSAGLAAYVQFIAKRKMLYNPQALEHRDFLKSVS